MHLHEFANAVTFREIAIGGTLPATEEYREYIKKMHPSQVIIPTLDIPMYEVTYSYRTQRNNYREAKKIMFVTAMHDEIDFQIELAFEDWVEKNNKERQFHQISNANILDIREVAIATLSIELQK